MLLGETRLAATWSDRVLIGMNCSRKFRHRLNFRGKSSLPVAALHAPSVFVGSGQGRGPGTYPSGESRPFLIAGPGITETGSKLPVLDAIATDIAVWCRVFPNPVFFPRVFE